MELIGFIFLFFIATLILRVIIMFEDIIRTQDQEARAAYIRFTEERALKTAAAKSVASKNISTKAQINRVNSKKNVTKLTSPRRTTAQVMHKVSVKAA